MTPLQALKMAASSVQVPFELLRAICTVESNLDPLALNKDDGNSASHGLCQIKYATAHLMGYRGAVKGLYSAKVNALYAAKYLRHQLSRYKGNWVKAVSAYNRGTASTRNSLYVKKVFANILKEDSNVRSRCKNKKHTCSLREYANAL